MSDCLREVEKDLDFSKDFADGRLLGQPRESFEVSGLTPIGEQTEMPISVTELDGELCLAFLTVSDFGRIGFTRSTDGVVWNRQPPTGHSTRTFPGLVTHKGTLRAFFPRFDGNEKQLNSVSWNKAANRWDVHPEDVTGQATKGAVIPFSLDSGDLALLFRSGTGKEILCWNVDKKQLHDTSQSTKGGGVAFCKHRGLFHIVFVRADGSSGELLHAVSQNGVDYSLKGTVGQSTDKGSLPRLVSFRDRLVLFFTSTQSSLSHLTCIYDETTERWSQNQETGESSNHPPALVVFKNQLFTYFSTKTGKHEIVFRDMSHLVPQD